jgi:hypothetical protein
MLAQQYFESEDALIEGDSESFLHPANMYDNPYSPIDDTSMDGTSSSDVQL